MRGNLGKRVVNPPTGDGVDRLEIWTQKTAGCHLNASLVSIRVYHLYGVGIEGNRQFNAVQIVDIINSNSHLAGFTDVECLGCRGHADNSSPLGSNGDVERTDNEHG